MKFDPVAKCSKSKHCSIFEPNQKWSKVNFSNTLKMDQTSFITRASQVDQSSFPMHIQHVKRSPSHPLSKFMSPDMRPYFKLFRGKKAINYSLLMKIDGDKNYK